MGLFGKDVYVVNQPRPATEYVTKEINIHEHRQSTSDDARLLHDLEKEALNKITDAVYYKLLPTNIEAATIEMQHDVLTMGTNLYVVFDINGRKVTSLIQDEKQWHNKTQRERFEYIYRLVAEEITQNLLRENEAISRNLVKF